MSERLALERHSRAVELGLDLAAWRTGSPVEGGQHVLVEDVALGQEHLDRRRELVDPGARDEVLRLSA
jgi:hypothetical protein